MADLSKIKLNGTEYDLKDAVARTAINDIPIKILQGQYSGNTATISSTITANELYRTTGAVYLYIGKNANQTKDIYRLTFKNYDSNGGEPFYSFCFICISSTNGIIQILQSGNLFGNKARINSLTYNTITIPTKTSQITNDSGYITSYTETDPTVPAWAKEATKPSYTAAEVGATTISEVNSAIATAIGNINQFNVAIVSTLPTADIDTHTIYFKSNSSSSNNIYDEYMYISNNWELIGSTQIDLTPYALSANLATVATSGDYDDLTNTPNLATVATSGDYNDLTNKPTIPEDKLFLVNVTLNSLTSGTSDKSSAEIAAAVNAGKLPIVKTGMNQMSMMATLVNIGETQENEETYYTATFMYNDENTAHTSSPGFVTKAVMVIFGTNVILQIKTGYYITNYDLEEKGYLTSYTETDPTVPAWAKAATKPTYTAAEVGALPDTTIIPAAQVNADWDATSGVAQILHKPTIPNVPAWALTASKPTYTAAEVGALPSTYTAPVTSVNGQTGEVTLTIPAAQVQSDWNATSGMGVILNKPTIPAATTVSNTLASGTLIATINGTNIYAPAYTDADGVSY